MDIESAALNITKTKTVALVLACTLVALGCVPSATAADSEESPWPIMPTTTKPIMGQPCLSPESPPVAAPQRLVELGEQPNYPPAATDGSLVYVSLGDSYASGEGAPVTVEDACRDRHQYFIDGTAVEGNHCHRSVDAYPVKLWAALEEEDSSWTLDHRACSGATTKDSEDEQSWDETWGPWNDPDHEAQANPPQWASDPEEGSPEELNTSRQADLITITMTGNDLGFAKIVRDCILASYSGDSFFPSVTRVVSPWRHCSFVKDIEIALEEQAVTDRLITMYNSAKASLAERRGQLLVSGYPRPFPTSDKLPASCGLGVGPGLIDRNKMIWLNSVADRANAIARETAKEVGATYVDISDLLQQGDHTMCEDAAGPEPGKRWINRIIPTHKEWSAHPNAYMHDAQAKRMLACYHKERKNYCHYPSPTSVEVGQPANPQWPIDVGELLPMDGAWTSEPYIAYAFSKMGCSVEEGGPGLGIRLNDVGFGDATGDAIEDAVLTLECNPSTSAWPETALVLDGANGPAGAPIAGVLIDGTRTPVVLDATDFDIPGNGVVTITGIADHSVNGRAIKDAEFTRTFTWNGNGFTAGPEDEAWFASVGRGSCPAEAADSIPEAAGLVEDYETDSAVVYICAGVSGQLYYYGRTNAGTISLHADAVGDSVFRATNQADGHTYTYTVDQTELVITADGAVLARQPVEPLS